MPKLGVMRHFAEKAADTVDYVFVARRQAERLEDAVVLCRQGSDPSDYRVGLVHYPLVDLFADRTVLFSCYHDTTEHRYTGDVICQGQEPFMVFDILDDEYDFIMDDNRAIDGRYQKEVFAEWIKNRKSIGAPYPAEPSEMHEFDGLYTDLKASMMHRFDVIMQLAELFDPNLYFLDINGMNPDRTLKEFAKTFGPGD